MIGLSIWCRTSPSLSLPLSLSWKRTIGTEWVMIGALYRDRYEIVVAFALTSSLERTKGVSFGHWSHTVLEENDGAHLY